MTLETNTSYGGALVFSSLQGSLDLNGNTLTLSGDDNVLTCGARNGAIDVTGKVQFGGYFGDDTHDVSIDNNGVINQTGDGGIDGAMTISADSSYVITSDIIVNNQYAGGDDAVVVNLGTFSFAPPDVAYAYFAASKFTSSGTISVAAQCSLEIDGDVSLAGTIGGPGQLALSGARATIDTSDITAALYFAEDVATFELSVALSGSFMAFHSTLNVDPGTTLTLNNSGIVLGGVDIDGGGVVHLNGAATLYGSIGANRRTNVVDAGAIMQDGAVSLNGTLVIFSGHSYSILNLDYSHSSGGASAARARLS